MKETYLHIISFDNPYPPNYGGVIDVFYKIKALNALGVQIILHCYTEEQTIPEELKTLCKAVYFYKKKSSLIHLFGKTPYRVKIRDSKHMLSRILEDDFPVLFEGLHTTMLLKDKSILKNRTILVRAHNIEHFYSQGLSKSSKSLLKKFVYAIEAFRFKKYERILEKATTIFSISLLEHKYFKKRFKKVVFMPVFHESENVKKISERGEYALYHGDLSISDNIRAAEFIIDAFKKIDYPLIIASSTHQKSIRKKIQNLDNVNFVEIIDNAHLDTLFEGAHINVLYSFQRSGTKLKLINALYKSRFCVVNENITDDPEVLQLCSSVNTMEKLIETIQDLKKEPYNDYEKRKEILHDRYGILKNAETIREML